MKKLLLLIAVVSVFGKVTAQSGAALNFSGSSDFIQLSDPNFGTSNFTIETWLKPTNTAGAYVISTRTNEFGGAGNWFVISYNNGKIGMEMADAGFGTAYFETTGTPVTLGAWNHVALIRSGLQFSIYVNGILSGNYTDVGLRDFNTGVNSIRLSGWANVGVAFYTGAMDEVRFWNIARTPCQIFSFMNCEIPTTATGLVGNYHFNQGTASGLNTSVNTLTDNSASARTGALINFSLTGSLSNWITPGAVVTGYTVTAPAVTVNSGLITSGSSFTMTPSGGVSYTYTPSGPIVSPTVQTNYTVTGAASNGCTNTAVSTVSIQMGEALNFDGNDFIDLGNILPAGSSYTKEMWVYANSNTCNNLLSSGDDPFYLSGGKLAAGNGGNYNYVQDPANFPINSWTHAVVTYDAPSATMKLYVNGAMVASGNSAAAYSGIPTTYIGRHTGGCYFTGSLDEVRIWNRALCQAEIQNNMNGELPSGQTGLRAYYRMNQGTASGPNASVTTLTDASGNSNNAPLSNFALTGANSNWIAPGAITTGSLASVFSSPVSATAATTSITCNGLSSGSATITATGGSPYTYSWSPSGGTAATASALAAGNYSVLVKNICGASTTVTLTIAAPSAIATATGVTNVLCNGGNGSATITATGGTGTKTYLWSTGATTSTLSALDGVYSATVTDANGCKITTGVTISQPSALATSTAVANILCNGGNGSATITTTGGTGTKTYLWSTGATTSTLSALAGVYSATVTDANGCKIITGVTISQPSGLATSTAVSNVLCNGGNGSATITTTGGTGTKTYLWSTGATTSTLSALAGVYSATVTDANGCKITTSATITQPSALATNTAIANVLCNGGNGNATITATGGTISYTYVWSTGATTSTLSALAGVYSATVTDANGCKITTGATITQPSALATSTAVDNALCNSGNGTTTITATGGTTSYTYLWSNGAATSTLSALAGVYSATVTDANGCKITTGAIITQPSALLATSVGSSILCNGGMSTVTVTAMDGTASYTGIGTYTALAGTQTYTVTDANGCMATTSVSISEPALLIANASNSPILCNGGMSTINVTATGGTIAYTGVGTFTATAGTQTYTVTDANGCMTTTSLSISEPSVLVASATASPILCNGDVSSVTVFANGGITYYTGVGTYTAMAGTETYTVTDANGCMTTTSVSISEPAAITSVQSLTLCQGQTAIVGISTYSTAGTFTDVIASLINGCDSTITTDIMINTLPTVAVNSGVICSGQSFTMIPTGAITYTYSNGSDVAMPTIDATYTVVGTDANGCENMATSSVTVNALPVLTASTTNTLMCAGETATLSVTGATSYTWSTSDNTPDIAVTPSTQTSYTVEGTDMNGCPNSTTITQDVSLCTGVTQLSNVSSLGLSVYPNPTNGMVTIQLDNWNSEITTITLVNAIGQTVVSESTTSQKASFNLFHLAAGVYSVKAEGKGISKTVRLIKQ